MSLSFVLILVSSVFLNHYSHLPEKHWRSRKQQLLHQHQGIEVYKVQPIPVAHWDHIATWEIRMIQFRHHHPVHQMDLVHPTIIIHITTYHDQSLVQYHQELLHHLLGAHLLI